MSARKAIECLPAVVPHPGDGRRTHHDGTDERPRAAPR
jgi:hypothetical protein